MSVSRKTLISLTLLCAMCLGYFIAWLMWTYPEWFGLLPHPWPPVRVAIIQVGLPIPLVVFCLGIWRIWTNQTVTNN